MENQSSFRDNQTLYKGSFYHEIFQSSPVGQAIIDLNLNIISVNSRLFQCFQIEPFDVRSLPFCQVFNCIESRCKHQTCSRKKSCDSCGLLNAVRDILLTDTSITNSIISYSFRSGKRQMAKWFYLSGSKITAASNEHYAVLIFTDITELKHQEKRMREQLILDLATGAMNKYSLVDSLQKLVQSDVPDQCFTICMIDFDNFKEINDLYGHLMGDMVLKVFSNIARRHIRKSDIFGRYGGEEFIFVFRETAHSQSLQIINRIHIELTKYFANKLKTPVTFSAGMIYVKNKECSFPEYTALLGDVDRFLYQAKVHGRSRVVSNIGEFLFGNL